MQEERTYTLSEFTSEAPSHIARLKSSGKAEVLTIDGKAEVIVQDVAAYQVLLDQLDSHEAIKAVKESMAAYGRNEGVPMEEGMAALRAKHGIPSND